MLFNPFVSYLNLQVRSLSLAHSMGKSAFEVAQISTARVKVTPVMDTCMPVDPIEAAESEGMGVAINSEVRLTVQVGSDLQNEVHVQEVLREVNYDQPCNMDAQALDEQDCVSDAPNIRKWFSENAVAVEQDIFDDRIPNRRVYSLFGQAPNAPSAIAVLERHKQKIRAV